MQRPKYQAYKGVYFCRDEETGYYLNSTMRVRMHRYVWENEVGKIPEGFEVHHLDRDRANNSIDNLALMTSKAHRAIHAQDESRKETLRKNIAKAQEAARAWHSSPDGLAWHSGQGKRIAEQLEPREYTCEHCGKVFKAKPTGYHKYCSAACRAAARRDSGVDDEIRTCEVCGKLFSVSKYSKQRFCSIECRGKARTKLNAEKRAAGIPVRKGAKTSG